MSTETIFAKNFGRRVAVALLGLGLALGTQPISASAAPTKKEKQKKDSKKEKEKDKGQFASQTGAQCTPGTGAPSDAASTVPASIPMENVIAQFAQHESDFKIARDNYTYTQEVLVEDVAPNPGEYQLDSEIVFTPEGRRYENVTYAPQPTLRDFQLSPEDMKDLENIQPFVLTTEDLPKYDIQP